MTGPTPSTLVSPTTANQLRCEASTPGSGSPGSMIAEPDGIPSDEAEDAMATRALKTAIGNYPHTKPLKDGTVEPDGYTFEHVEVTPIIAAFRRMIRNLEFDVSEMAISTYIVARAHQH